MHVLIMPHPEDPPTFVAFTALMYLLEVTRSARPEQEVLVESPRSYAPWSVQEEQLVWCLWQAEDKNSDETKLRKKGQKPYFPAYKRIADFVQRTYTSIDSRIDALSKNPPKLDSLPQSSVQITKLDVGLLKSWNRPYDRDALAWRYGKPLDQAIWACSEPPTLRVVEVESDTELLPGAPHDAATAWRDQINAANATWVDLAVQLCTEAEGLILYTGEDPHGARLTALRSALKRHDSHARHTLPRQRVRNATPDVLTQLETDCPDVILLHEPELWPTETVQALKAHTVIVVVPFLPGPDGQAPSTGESDRLPAIQASTWLPHAPRTWKTQEEDLRQWGEGRTVERIRQHGIPNTSGTAARIDWPALRHLPGSGQVIAADDLLLLRAAAWYQLTTGLRPKMPAPEKPISSPLKDICNRTSVAEATSGSAVSEVSPTLLEKKIRRRLQLDLDSHQPSADSDLSLALSDKLPVVYIGR